MMLLIIHMYSAALCSEPSVWPGIKPSHYVTEAHASASIDLSDLVDSWDVSSTAKKATLD